LWTATATGKKVFPVPAGRSIGAGDFNLIILSKNLLASNFGIPQKRERVFIIGIKN
jgi:hypothetical protein